MERLISMIKSYRTNISITADILDATRQWVGITAILQKANLPHNRATKLVQDLVKSGLVVEDEGQYNLSPTGLTFLAEHNRYKAVAESFGLRL